MGRRSARSSRNFKLLDLSFDFVDEVGCAGAVDDTVVERAREGDYFGSFVFLSVWHELAMGGADKERAD